MCPGKSLSKERATLRGVHRALIRHKRYDVKAAWAGWGLWAGWGSTPVDFFPWDGRSPVSRPTCDIPYARDPIPWGLGMNARLHLHYKIIKCPVRALVRLCCRPPALTPMCVCVCVMCVCVCPFRRTGIYRKGMTSARPSCQ
jgi:hypothetical protein